MCEKQKTIEVLTDANFAAVDIIMQLVKPGERQYEE